MLINEMRFGNVTLSWVHTNLVLKKIKNLRRVETFKVFGMKMIALSHGAFCLPCFLFHKPIGHDGQNAFTVNGFKSWKKVRNVKVVLLAFIWGKILTPLIELPIKHV